MPEISRFLGIVIRMLMRGQPGAGRREHGPGHFHAIYDQHQETVDIETLEFKEVRGYERLPPRVRNLVKEWAELHRTDLRVAWVRAQSNQAPLPYIPGLE